MSQYRGKKVLVVGLGTSGVAVTRYMVQQGARVMITDAKQRTELAESLKELGDLKVEMELGGHQERHFLGAELIVVSPGVPLTMKYLDMAREKQIPVTTEIELALKEVREPVIAITGTNGKTTTTSLIGEMIRADGKTAFVGGNIGQPLLTYVVNQQKADFIVLEVSSFQLELVESLRPAVSIFTNMDQDHLDRYGTMDAYMTAKKRLLRMSGPDTLTILNHECPIVSKFVSDAPGPVAWFLKQNPMSISGEFAEKFHGAYIHPQTGKMMGKFGTATEEYDLTKLKIFGDHNKENLMAAATAARSVGISSKAVQKVIDEFRGVPHRLELVRKKDGVYFFNDSKATTPVSVMRSLQAFKKSPIILIMGGKDKGLEFNVLQDIVRQKCKILILLGEAKEKINRSLGDYCDTFLVGTFEEAVLLAFQKSRTGDIVLLSPGCASYDMFRNFEERGEYFKKLVQQL